MALQPDLLLQRHSRRSVLLCLLAALCEGLDLQAAGLSAAGVREQFHPQGQWLSYFFSASTFGLLFGAIVGGRIADRIGRKPVLVGSVALFGVFSLLTPLAWDMGSLTLARLLTGLGLGGALPNLIALGAENAPPNRRSAYVTMIYSGTPLGGALASLVSLLTTAAHWRWIFLVGGALPVMVAPAISWWLQEGQTVAGLRAAAAAFGRRQVGLLAFLEDGRTPRTLLLWTSFLFALLTLYLLLNWLPTLLADSGLGKSQVAAGMIGFNLGGCLSAIYIGFHMETQHHHRGVVLTFVGVPLLIILLAVSPPQAVVVASIVCALGAAVVAAQAILYALAPLCYPTRMRATGVGFAVAMGRVGSVIGPLVGGALVGAGRTPSQVLTGVLPITIVGGLCAIAVAWRKPVEPGE